jgi:Ribbon-helix-helix protein, copG family.
MKPEIWEKCCRDLKVYLESALAGAKGGVISVKLNRLLEVSGSYAWKRRYAWCLSKVLHRYKFNIGLYVLTRQQAEELLNILDAACAEAGGRKKQRETTREEPAPPDNRKQEKLVAEAMPINDGEKMYTISFRLPRALLQALEEYARRLGLTRSDVIRMAVNQMLKMVHLAEDTMETKKVELVTVV